MPFEVAEGEGYAKIPNLDVAQALFTLQAEHSSAQDKGR